MGPGRSSDDVMCPCLVLELRRLEPVAVSIFHMIHLQKRGYGGNGRGKMEWNGMAKGVGRVGVAFESELEFELEFLGFGLDEMNGFMEGR